MEGQGIECEDWMWYKEVKKEVGGQWCVQRERLAVHLVCGEASFHEERVAYRLEVFIASSAFHTSRLACIFWSCQKLLRVAQIL